MSEAFFARAQGLSRQAETPSRDCHSPIRAFSLRTLTHSNGIQTVTPHPYSGYPVTVMSWCRFTFHLLTTYTAIGCFWVAMFGLAGGFVPFATIKVIDMAAQSAALGGAPKDTSISMDARMAAPFQDTR